MFFGYVVVWMCFCGFFGDDGGGGVYYRFVFFLCLSEFWMWMNMIDMIIMMMVRMVVIVVL